MGHPPRPFTSLQFTDMLSSPPMSSVKKNPVPSGPPAMVSALTYKFFGTDERVATQAFIHTALYLLAKETAKQTAKRAIGLMVPGPGWAYAGIMVAWDLAQIYSAYSDCRSTGGPNIE
jgi:hypothetical protein